MLNVPTQKSNITFIKATYCTQLPTNTYTESVLLTYY